MIFTSSASANEFVDHLGSMYGVSPFMTRSLTLLSSHSSGKGNMPVSRPYYFGPDCMSDLKGRTSQVNKQRIRLLTMLLASENISSCSLRGSLWNSSGALQSEITKKAIEKSAHIRCRVLLPFLVHIPPWPGPFLYPQYSPCSSS